GVIIADGSPLDIFKDQYEVLLNHGIWIPEVCMFAHDLQRSGLELDPFPLTLDGAHTAISSVFSGQSSLVGTQMPTARNVDANTAIEVRNLTFSYGAKQILNSISLDIAAGDFVALIGANGAGKTTLAQTIMGILTPLSGTIYINGEAAANLPANQIVEQIGYVFQNPEHQFITNTVFDEIAYALRVRGLDQASVQKKTEDMLVRFALSEYKGKSPFMLSHGEKRRLSVATMLAMGQSILIFDEPTFGQDQQNADAIMSLLSDLHAGGCTVIIITHDMRLVAEYVNHVVVLNQGHILFNGLPQDMFAQADLLREAHLQLPPMAELATRLNIPMVITRQQLQDTVVAQLGS
ncbi:MAG: ATP-binding cassette domain-containing protein, partial [Chloroflexota bacterium]